MASSKTKLTEEQLQEGIFGNILSNILNNRIATVEKALKDNPRLKKASQKADKALKELRKELKKQGGPTSSDIKKSSPSTRLKFMRGEL